MTVRKKTTVASKPAEIERMGSAKKFAQEMLDELNMVAADPDFQIHRVRKRCLAAGAHPPTAEDRAAFKALQNVPEEDLDEPSVNAQPEAEAAPTA
jgi:hypothetical protein